MKKRLSAADLQQIDKMGLSREDIENQLRIFENGFPDLQLIKPARLQDGIVSLSERQFIDFQHNYLEGIQAKKVMKFIPSSGAASRMFKFLFDYLENPVYASEQIEYFIKHIKDFAFYEDLKILLKKEGEEVDTLIKKKQYTLIFHYLLSIGGLNYGNLPKALIKFHKYNDFTRTPVEEHIVESADYCINDRNKSALHFTISPEHEDLFNSHVSYIKGFYERAFKAKFEISYSFQKRYTDILAVKPNNEILRDGEGRLVFRPGGHGALLENLNDIEADVVFIKNVDNVVVDKFKQEGNDYKKALAGLMLHYQNKIFYYLNELDK